MSKTLRLTVGSIARPAPSGWFAGLGVRVLARPGPSREVQAEGGKKEVRTSGGVVWSGRLATAESRGTRTSASGLPQPAAGPTPRSHLHGYDQCVIPSNRLRRIATWPGHMVGKFVRHAELRLIAARNWIQGRPWMSLAVGYVLRHRGVGGGAKR
jgi:hypothetical protein